MGIPAISFESLAAAAATPEFWLSGVALCVAGAGCYLARARISRLLGAVDVALRSHPSLISTMLMVGGLVSAFHHSFVPMLIQFVAASYVQDKALDARMQRDRPQWRDDK